MVIRNVGIAALLLPALVAAGGVRAEERAAMVHNTARMLAEAKEPVRIVGFGDSITGVYYHTGGRRAWPEMLGVALGRLYPQATTEVTNAGISGDTTAGALARIERDVLSRKPHLVVVMFGMNDVARVPIETYRENLAAIVRRCRASGAEVILCTPNSIYPEDGGRPVERLAQFAEGVRRVGGDLDVPVADCYQAYEDLRAADRRAWMGLMSETIHPNMRGHKLFAEVIAGVISGKRASLADVPPLSPGLAHTAAKLARGLPIRVVAMAPYDAMIAPALRSIRPDVRVEVTSWPVEAKTLSQIEAEAKARGWATLRNAPREQWPDLVLLAVPAGARAESEERFYRSYSWVVNWSLSFGRSEWDCLLLLPSVASPALDGDGRTAEAAARYVVQAQDLPWLERAVEDKRPAQEVLAGWLRALVPCRTQ